MVRKVLCGLILALMMLSLNASDQRLIDLLNEIESERLNIESSQKTTLLELQSLRLELKETDSRSSEMQGTINSLKMNLEEREKELVKRSTQLAEQKKALERVLKLLDDKATSYESLKSAWKDYQEEVQKILNRWRWIAAGEAVIIIILALIIVL